MRTCAPYNNYGVRMKWYQAHIQTRWANHQNTIRFPTPFDSDGDTMFGFGNRPPEHLNRESPSVHSMHISIMVYTHEYYQADTQTRWTNYKITLQFSCLFDCDADTMIHYGNRPPRHPNRLTPIMLLYSVYRANPKDQYGEGYGTKFIGRTSAKDHSRPMSISRTIKW